MDNNLIYKSIKNNQTDCIFTTSISNSYKTNFNTGLFMIKTNILFKFMDDMNIPEMINNSESLEKILYNYFVDNDIPYIKYEKMNLVWINNITNKLILH